MPTTYTPLATTMADIEVKARAKEVIVSVEDKKFSMISKNK